MPKNFKELCGTREDMLFGQLARILSDLIAEHEYGLPIGVYVQDADGRKVWGSYRWEPKNFSLAFGFKKRHGRGKFRCPVVVEFRDGTGEASATAVLEEEVGTDSGKFRFELRGV